MCNVKRKMWSSSIPSPRPKCLHLSHETINIMATVEMYKGSLLKVEQQNLNYSDLPTFDL